MKSKNPFLHTLKKTLFLYFIESAAVFIILKFIYEPVTLGFNTENYIVLALPTLLGCTLFQYCMGPDLISRSYIGHGLVGWLWALTYPVLFSLSYTKPLYFYQFYSDFLFGLFIFILLSSSQYLCTRWWGYQKTLSFIWACFDILLLIFPGIQIAYYLQVNHCITPATLMALYNSNPSESFEYALHAVGTYGLIAAILGLCLLLYILYRANKRLYTHVENHDISFGKRLFLTLQAVILIIYTSYFLFPTTNILVEWKGVVGYMKELQSYHSKHDAIFADTKLLTTTPLSKKLPGTVILVIGESASRSHMQVYSPNFPYPDTPWESEMKETNANFIFFPHAYSSYVQTVPTLENALTEKNQYNDKPFLEAASIIDIAKKAGYHTYWFSNQGLFGQYDTPIALIAKTADTPKWAHESFEFSDKYDGALLPLLKEVNPNENNFIVLHLMGSHIYYNDRYPSEFSIFKKTDPPMGKEAYANSILYTDHILKEIYTYGKEHLHMQAMIYFSDHGESLTKSHNPDIFDFDMTRIPFWIYLSPNYEKTYPQTVYTLKNRKNQYITNDLLYDFISGILQAPSNRYDPRRDFSHPQYMFTRDTLKTMLGTRPLTDDTDEQ